MGSLLRFVFFRLLPERLLPFLTVWEIYQLVKKRHGRPAESPDVARRRAAARAAGRKPLW